MYSIPERLSATLFALPWPKRVPAPETRHCSLTLTLILTLALTLIGNEALLLAGRSVVQAVPGYVITPEMTSAKLFVTTPAGVSIEGITVSDEDLMTVEKLNINPDNVVVEYAVTAKSRGRQPRT